MALDPSIILQAGKGVTPLLSPADIQAQQMEREIGTYKLNALSQQADDDASYRNVLRSGVSAADLPNKLYGAGLGKQAQEAQKFQLDQQKSQREAQRAELEGHLKQFELAGQIMNGVTDQASWDRARQDTARIFGPEKAAQMPAQYDPQLIAQNQARAMTVKDQLELQYKRLTQAETQRHNLATESNTLATNANTVNATLRGQNMGDERARELAQLKSQELAATRQAQAQEKGVAAVDKKVTAFSTQLDKTNIPQFETLLGDIEADIAKYKDIPGYGGIMGNLPTFMQTEEGKALRQKIATLRNLTLKDRSGAAVTNQELNRLLEELGTGVFTTDKDLTRGLAGVRQNLDSVKQNVVAGVDDATLSEYQARGGMALKRGAQKPPAANDLSGLEAELRKRGILK